MQIQEQGSPKSEEHQEGLFPIVEINLFGNFTFDRLIDVLHEHYKVPYKLIKADIEYNGKVNFGRLLIKLEGNVMQNKNIFQFFQQNKIQNQIQGYT